MYIYIFIYLHLYIYIYKYIFTFIHFYISIFIFYALKPFFHHLLGLHNMCRNHRSYWGKPWFPASFPSNHPIRTWFCSSTVSPTPRSAAVASPVASWSSCFGPCRATGPQNCPRAFRNGSMRRGHHRGCHWSSVRYGAFHGGYPKSWMLCRGKMESKNEWELGYPFLGNPHIWFLDISGPAIFWPNPR